MSKNKRKKLVYIEWEDSTGGSGRWTDIEEMIPDPPVHKSIGWLMHETKKWIVLVPHISGEPNHPTVLFAGSGEMTIPKSAILKKKIITV